MGSYRWMEKEDYKIKQKLGSPQEVGNSDSQEKGSPLEHNIFTLPDWGSEAKVVSKQIDRNLARYQEEESKIIKVLLLGPGECGKSTILKQIKYLHNKGYTKSELKLYKPAIHANTIQGLMLIIQAMIPLNIDLVNPTTLDDISAVFDQLIASQEFHNNMIRAGIDKLIPIFRSQEILINMTPELATLLKNIWSDVGIQMCAARSHEYKLFDSAIYFLNDLNRIVHPDYLPTFNDILRCRIQTSGVVEMTYQFKDRTFRMIDVGGQRSSRKRWIHCFDGVWAVIFVAALTDYHLDLEECPGVNRLEESLNVFNTIIKCPELSRASKLLFLNKTDLFTRSIQEHKIPLAQHFPQFEGPPEDADAAMEFILKEFEKVYNTRSDDKTSDAKLYYHFTCATNTENIDAVFCVSSDAIIKQSLMELGLY